MIACDFADAEQVSTYVVSCSKDAYTWRMSHNHNAVISCPQSLGCNGVNDPTARWRFKPSTHETFIIDDGKRGNYAGELTGATWNYFYDYGGGALEERDQSGAGTSGGSCIAAATAWLRCTNYTVPSGYNTSYGDPAIVGKGIFGCNCGNDVLVAGTQYAQYWNVSNQYYYGTKVPPSP